MANGFPHPGIWYDEAAAAVAMLRATNRITPFA